MKNKQYLRWVADGKCGVVASLWCNMVILKNKKTPLVATAACEDVLIWNIKQAEHERLLQSNDRHQVTVLSIKYNLIAAAFRNGSIMLYDLEDSELKVTLNGHRSPVSCLNFDLSADRLVSGSMDTDLVLWDVNEEAGLFRLKGHTAPITMARFLDQSNVLISSSKDTTLKFWDLETQHCFKTIIDHSTEIYDFILAKQNSIIITASGVSDLSVWSIKAKEKNDVEQVDNIDFLDITKLGGVERKGKGHVISMCQDESHMYFGCHGTDNKIEIYKMYTDEESDKHKKKSDKKKKLKAAKRKVNGEEVEESVSEEKTVDDYVKKVAFFKVKHPIRTFQILSLDSQTIKMVVMFRNNSLKYYDLQLPASINRQSLATSADDNEDVKTWREHTKEPINVVYSSSGMSFMSISKESVKIWNGTTLKGSHMAVNGGTCGVFAFDDRKAVIGTLEGSMRIYDLENNDLLEEVPAHQSAVTCIALSHDKLGIVTGSRDKMLIFWDLEFESSSQQTRFTLKADKRVEMADEVLCLSYSTDQKYIVAGCLDRKGYILFADSLKTFKVLYSHHLPITCVDISTDTTTLATGSGDKDIKVWSMDFGECKKIIKVAHDDKITGLKFIPKTHMFFTCGRDCLLKQWDADNFQLITTLQGHQAAIHSLSISSDGTSVVTCGEDMSIRKWIKTDEILVLEEEKEMAREKEEEDEIRDDVLVLANNNTENAVANKKTKSTLSAVERLMEALDIHKEEEEKEKEHERNCKEQKKQLPKPTPHLLLTACQASSPDHYLKIQLGKIKSSEIEGCLSCLPFPYKTRLIQFLCRCHGDGDIYVTRSLLYLLRQDAGVIISSRMFENDLQKCVVEGSSRNILYQNMSGFNVSACTMLRMEMLLQQNSSFESHPNKQIKLKI